MALTRKHFELIAEAIRVERPTKPDPRKLNHVDVIVNATLDQIADNLAANLAMVNPRFDRERFIKATREEE